MNKHIEEMAKTYDEARYKATETIGSMNEGAGQWYAKAFYNAGYRRASEVAKEIFEEIETSLQYKLINGEIHLIIREADYNEYKKKFVGWIGNVAVIPTKDGRWLVERHTGKRQFVRFESEGAE